MLHSLFQSNIQSLIDLDKLLQQVSHRQYCNTVAPFPSSAGKHFRHITEHIQQFLAGLEPAHINYDNRSRQILLETDTVAMQAMLGKLIPALAQASKDNTLNRQLLVELCVNQHARVESVASSIGRELVFLHSHTIHHCSQIAAILALQGIKVDIEFGTAPATLKHSRLQNQALSSDRYKHCA